MPIDVRCEQCQKKIRIPDKAAGKRVKCPNCTYIISIPAFSPTETGSGSASASELSFASMPPPSKDELSLAPNDSGSFAASTVSTPSASFSPSASSASPSSAAPPIPPASSGSASFSFPCGSCGNQLRAPSSAVGKKARCPKCQTVQVVPSVSESVVSSKPRTSTQPAPKPQVAVQNTSFSSQAAATTDPFGLPAMGKDPFGLPALDDSDPFADSSPGEIYGLSPATDPFAAPARGTVAPGASGGAAPDPFAGLLPPSGAASTPPPTAENFNESGNPYQSPKATAARSKKKGYDPTYAESVTIGGLVSGTFSAYFANFGLFINLGSQIFGCWFTVNITLRIINWVVDKILLAMIFTNGYSAGTIAFLCLYFLAIIITYLVAYTILNCLGGMGTALQIVRGGEPESIFGFNQGSFARGIGINVLHIILGIGLLFGLIVYSLGDAATQWIPFMSGGQQQMEEFPVEEPMTDEFDESTGEETTEGGGEESSEQTEESPAEVIMNDSSQEMPTEPDTFPDAQNGADAPPWNNHQPPSASFFATAFLGMFYFMFVMYYIIFSMITLPLSWSLLFYIDEDESFITGLVNGLKLYFTNCFSITVSFIIVMVPAYLIGSIFCCAVGSTIISLPLVCCFYAVTYLQITGGGGGSRKKRRRVRSEDW